MSESEKKHFSSCVNAFFLSFPNGYTISTQFGACNYGDNYDSMDFKTRMDSNEVEVGILKNNELVITPFNDGDIVIGYVTFEKWLEILEWVKKQPKEAGVKKGEAR